MFASNLHEETECSDDDPREETRLERSVGHHFIAAVRTRQTRRVGTEAHRPRLHDSHRLRRGRLSGIRCYSWRGWVGSTTCWRVRRWSTSCGRVRGGSLTRLRVGCGTGILGWWCVGVHALFFVHVCNTYRMYVPREIQQGNEQLESLFSK